MGEMIKYPLTAGRARGYLRAKRNGRHTNEDLNALYHLAEVLDIRILGSIGQYEMDLISRAIKDKENSEILVKEPPKPKKDRRRPDFQHSSRRNSPVTVRDAQRIATKSVNQELSSSGDIFDVAFEELGLPDGVMYCPVDGGPNSWYASTGLHHKESSAKEAKRFFDQLSSDSSQVVMEVDRNGRKKPFGRFAPKGTDKVRGQSDNPSVDSPFHGGDGNSGEVMAKSATKGSTATQAPQDGDEDAGEMRPRSGGSTSGSSSVPGNTAECSHAGTELTQASGQEAASSPGGTGATAGSTALPVASDNDCEKSDALSSRDAHLMGSEDPERFRSSDSRDDRQRTGPRKPHSGVTPTAERWAKSFFGTRFGLQQAKPTPKLIKRAQRAFQSILDAGAADEVSHRWDYPEFCTRLKTYRDPRQARRVEQGRPAILVVADTSGSVGAIGNEALTAAKAVGTLGVSGADVIVINSDNGRPDQVEINGKNKSLLQAGGTDCSNEEKTLTFYQKVVKKWDVKIVVIIGDGDDKQCRTAIFPLPGLLKVVYLSSYCCSYGGPRRSRDKDWFTQYGGPGGNKNIATWWDRCESADDFVSCLES